MNELAEYKYFVEQLKTITKFKDNNFKAIL